MKIFLCFFSICIFRSKNCVWLNWVFIQSQRKKGRMFCFGCWLSWYRLNSPAGSHNIPGSAAWQEYLGCVGFLSNKHCCVLLGCSLVVLWEDDKQERMCSMKEIVLLMEYYRKGKCWIEGGGFWLMILVERALLLLCTLTDNWETNTIFRI